MLYEIWSNAFHKAGGTGDTPFIRGYRSSDPMEKSWEGEIGTGSELLHGKPALEYLFAKFNADDRPNGQIAHSLSVGDVVVLNGDHAYACCMAGWQRILVWKPLVYAR